MMSSAWSRVSTGRVVSSSHSRVPFQGAVPDAHALNPDRRAARRAMAQRQKLQRAPRHADDHLALPGQDGGRAQRARRAVSDPPPAAKRRSCAARTIASQPVSRTLSRGSKTSAPRSATKTKRVPAGGRPIVATVCAHTADPRVCRAQMVW